MTVLAASASTPKGSVTFRVIAGFVALTIAEVTWFVWFESRPLPNGNNIPRWLFLARALPYVAVEGLTLDESYLGLALKELANLGNLAQRLPIVAAAGLIVAAAFGLGGMALRALRLVGSLSRAERWGTAFGLGMTGLGSLTLVLGRLGGLGPWRVRSGLAAVAAAEVVLLIREWESTRKEPAISKSGNSPARKTGAWLLPHLGFGAVVAPFLVMMALGSMLPTIDYDALEYHLQGPKEYYQAGRIAFLPHNVYTSMPFGVEMLHLLGMEVLDDWWWGALAGQLLIAAHAPMAALMLAQAVRRVASPRAAWFAAAVYLTTPWVYRLAVLPYVEGPLGYYHAALIWAGLRAWSETGHLERRRFWGMAGLLAGGAMACKYPALVSAVVPFGVFAFVDTVRRRSVGPLLAFSLGWVVVMSPWLGKNVIDTRNPVYPLGYKVFGGWHWGPEMDAKFARGHGPKPITGEEFCKSVLDVAGRSDWQSPLFAALAPLAFLRHGSRRFAAVIGGYVVYLFLTWWLLTHRLDRFWLPLLPGLAILAGLGADWSLRLGWRILLGLIVGVAVVANLSYSSTALTALNEWTGDLRKLRTGVPRMLDPTLSQADEGLPPGAKLLIVGQAAVFHVNHPIVYNTVFDDESFETLARGRSPAEVHDALQRLGITHIYVDWFHIDRFRSPGNYGFTDFVQPAEFDRLVKAGVLERAVVLAAQRELYRVRDGRHGE